MFGAAEWLALGVGTATAAALWRATRSVGQHPSAACTADASTSYDAWPEPTLPVMTFEALLQSTQTRESLTRTESTGGLNAATWKGLIQPVIENVAQLVQSLPASEAHHHAQPGGLWIHTCETLAYALQYRSAFVLPPDRDADDVARDRHRWTAGVLLAALLHDVGKTVTDVRVRLYGPRCAGSNWNALAGTMQDAGAVAYAVAFPPEQERDYRAHQRLGALLLQRLVPPETLIWIGEDKPLLDALMQYLQGDTDSANPIARIVTQAEAESVRHNLRDGPRTRFASARAVPLIERLMDALRRMLAEGGRLPLNRPGAAGYVHQGELWFAAARLANAVRDYLVEHESAAGIPGEDKNDRLFDVWQDYGACLTNPSTGRAIFSGHIEFDPGIGTSYELPAMLRFPLESLYPSAAQYPKAMPGRIVPIDAVRQPPTEPDTDPDTSTGLPAAGNTATPMDSAAAAPVVSAVGRTQQAPSPTQSGADAFLADGDAAHPSDLARPARTGAAPALTPVAPSLKLPGAGDHGKPIPERAIAFMRWLQTEVASGAMPYNAAGAHVHFVRHGEATALLLVSPVIFQRYEQQQPELTDASPGLATQRAFSAALWHLRAKGGKNIWSYQVMRAGKPGGSLLNGFLLLEPERFFAPVPPVNERLIAWNSSPTPGKAP